MGQRARRALVSAMLYMRQAGFTIGEIATRPPYEFEYQTTRIYVLATRSALETNP